MRENLKPLHIFKSEKTVAVSGGFDPIHDGHIAMIEAAARLGKVFVILNSDEFLRKKKGYVFQGYSIREKIITALKNVYAVVPCIDDDETVRKTLRQLRPDIFLKSGDRNIENTPEYETCREFGIAFVVAETNTGKESHSSVFVTKAVEALRQ